MIIIPKITPNEYFKLDNGVIIKHLFELPIFIENMSDYKFNTYVTHHKNDFAKWIHDVFKLQELSNQLGGIKSKEETLRILRAYLRPHIENTFVNSDTNIEQNKNQITNKTINQKDNQTIVRDNSNKYVYSNEITPVKNAGAGVKFAWKHKPGGNSSDTSSNNNTQQGNQSTTVVIPQKPKVEKVIKPIQVSKPIVEEKKSEIVEKSQDKNIQTNSIDADKYFEENPLLVSQMVETKKKNLKNDTLSQITYNEDDKIEKKIELFKDHYMKVYQKLVFLRKNGYDTKIAQVMLFRIPAKIKMFEASKEKKDEFIIKRYLNEIVDELNSIDY